MWNIIGQDHLLNGLESSFRQKRQSHAYLLCGPPHVGKMALAINLCQAINCLEGSGEPCGSCDQCTRIAEGNHSDIRVLAPGQGTEGRAARTMIGINEIKEALAELSCRLPSAIARRGGRVVDGSGLENQRRESVRGFESHPLRSSENEKKAKSDQ